MKHVILFFLSLVSASGLMAQNEMQYFNHTQIGVFIGEESEDQNQKSLIPSFQTIHGIRFTENLGLGIGVGAEPFEYMVYPVFVNGYLLSNCIKHKPYLALKIGHAFSNSHKKFNNYGIYGDYTNKGGFMIHPEVGVRLKIADYDLTLSAGYRFQRLKSDISQGVTSSLYYSYSHQVDYNRVSFSLGLMF